jgi:inorganic pyrophosphatase
MPNLINLPARNEQGRLNVVVEVPRGSRAKIRYEPMLDTFCFSRPLVLGTCYPYDWGFIPSTIAEDGDPLDAMVYHDVPTYPGVVIPSKAIGIVRLTQKIKGEKRTRNDRIIVVPADEKRWNDATALETRVHKELEQFFVIVVMMTGKKVRIEGWEGPKAANMAIEKAVRAYGRGEKSSTK